MNWAGRKPRPFYLWIIHLEYATKKRYYIYTYYIYIQGGYHVIRFIKPIMIFSFLSAHLVAQNVCPPSNLEVTPGVGTVTVSWENPGI